jgi:hypothetical protein
MSETDDTTKVTKLTEREKLEKEKIALATELGIWGDGTPVDNFKDTPQHKRINEINKKLWELVK